MCYASAEGRFRSAKKDEVLVVRRQPHGANWLVSPDDSNIAVCLKDGTEVELLYVPEQTQQRFKLQGEIRAIFKMEQWWWWRQDMFVASNGRKVPLKKLQPGQVVRVLSGNEAANAEKFGLQEECVESLATDRAAS